jgi:PleD family two-component response regulator
MITFEPTVVVVNDYSHTFSDLSIHGCHIISSVFDGDSVIAIASKNKPSLIVLMDSKSSDGVRLQLKNNWETRDIPVIASQSSSISEMTSEIRINILLRTSVSSFGN